MKILTLTTLFPSASSPSHGVFVENRLAAYQSRHGGDIRVVAPVPWFPFTSSIFGRYAHYAKAPLTETRRGLAVSHPRYVIPPKIGMSYAVSALTQRFLQSARDAIASGWCFDIIDAHYLYPDGVAAVRVANEFGKPVVLTARGSDVTLLPTFKRPRALILDAAQRADAIVTVAEALKRDLVDLGASAEKISTLRNGVDLVRFQPLDRDSIRRKFNLDGLVIASVGQLIARKGHDIAIAALRYLPNATLLIAGEGPLKERLQATAEVAGVSGRVRFLGTVKHEALAEVYNAADLLVLASDREGWPNVLLEAMACGAPAVASDAGGNSEVISSPEGGAIVHTRLPQDFAQAILRVLESSDRSKTRAFAERFSWDETSDNLHALFQSVIARHAR